MFVGVCEVKCVASLGGGVLLRMNLYLNSLKDLLKVWRLNVASAFHRVRSCVVTKFEFVSVSVLFFLIIPIFNHMLDSWITILHVANEE